MKLILFVGQSLLLCGVEDVVGGRVELEVSIDLFASETGCYVIENIDGNGDLIYPGHSPDISVVADTTLTSSKELV